MKKLRGWPFEPMDGINPCGGEGPGPGTPD